MGIILSKNRIRSLGGFFCGILSSRALLYNVCSALLRVCCVVFHPLQLLHTTFPSIASFFTLTPYLLTKE
jgi:hypothetical protein